jgi:3-oxoacyl-[acyl-carrier-protein] synthase II
MVLGEGAGVLILETLEEAEKRNAKIFGEVVGYGSSSVVRPDGSPDQKTAFTNVLNSALETSGMKPSEVGHIHAHGLSSNDTDRAEAAAIREVMPETSVTAAKSYMGNLGGGSGIVEIIASLMALQEQQHIPVLNYETPDPDCAIRVVQDEGESPGDSFINLNITPQAQASSVLIRRFN